MLIVIFVLFFFMQEIKSTTKETFTLIQPILLRQRLPFRLVRVCS